jgi:hypothetical protein
VFNVPETFHLHHQRLVMEMVSEKLPTNLVLRTRLVAREYSIAYSRGGSCRSYIDRYIRICHCGRWGRNSSADCVVRTQCLVAVCSMDAVNFRCRQCNVLLVPIITGQTPVIVFIRSDSNSWDGKIRKFCQLFLQIADGWLDDGSCCSWDMKPEPVSM